MLKQLGIVLSCHSATTKETTKELFGKPLFGKPNYVAKEQWSDRCLIRVRDFRALTGLV
ncbi:MAG: hypothetical protein JWO71_3372 [Candidatus Acidoferrum typicum]|nr:hypothetical protein [Candidatus Acidoferrum typicum]